MSRFPSYLVHSTDDPQFQDWSFVNERRLAIPSLREIRIKTNCVKYNSTEYEARRTNNNSFDGDLAWMNEVLAAVNLPPPTVFEPSLTTALQSIPYEAITFFNFDFNGTIDEYHCGPRCAKISAVELLDSASENVFHNIINCNVHVSEISNTGGNEALQMPNGTALTAAGSIALDATNRDPGGQYEDLAYQFVRYNNMSVPPHTPPHTPLEELVLILG